MGNRKHLVSLHQFYCNLFYFETEDRKTVFYGEVVRAARAKLSYRIRIVEKNTFHPTIRKESSHESKIPQPGRGCRRSWLPDAAASAIYCAMPFLVVHYLGDWRLTPPWLVLPAGMLAVTLYCLIRELSTVMIADGNICLRCLGFKVTEFPLEELRTAKLIFKNGQCSCVLSLCSTKETDLRAAPQNRQSPWREKHSVRSNDETVGAVDKAGLAAAV